MPVNCYIRFASAPTNIILNYGCIRAVAFRYLSVRLSVFGSVRVCGCKLEGVIHIEMYFYLSMRVYSIYLEAWWKCAGNWIVCMGRKYAADAVDRIPRERKIEPVARANKYAYEMRTLSQFRRTHVHALMNTPDVNYVNVLARELRASNEYDT